METHIELSKSYGYNTIISRFYCAVTTHKQFNNKKISFLFYWQFRSSNTTIIVQKECTELLWFSINTIDKFWILHIFDILSTTVSLNQKVFLPLPNRLLLVVLIILSIFTYLNFTERIIHPNNITLFCLHSLVVRFGNLKQMVRA